MMCTNCRSLVRSMIASTRLSLFMAFFLASSLTIVAAEADAQSVQQASFGESVERHLSKDEPITQWTQDAAGLNREASDMIIATQSTRDEFETVKLQNVIPPVRFDSGAADIPSGYIESLRKVLDGMRERQNVRLHLIGHTDDQELSATLMQRYDDTAGLSRERAGEVVEFLKSRLNLRPEAVSYEWAGDTKPIATNATTEGRALNRRVEVEVWYDQPQQRAAEEQVLLKENFRRIKVCRMETVCKMRFMEGHSRRARIKNLVPPLHFRDDSTEVSDAFVEHVRKALHNLQGKQNVMVKFTGYTDDLPLSSRDERIYGTQLALSKARAHRVELAIQERLSLPTAAVASDGQGAKRPLASNETEQGRALNRRIEVEFWYDDPLQELPDEPQICPNDGDGEMVTKVYDPAWGRIAPLDLEGGRAIIPAGYTDQLRRAMSEVADKTNVRLRFIGYTKNERLDRRTASAYGDDVGLSAARARRAMDTIREQMQLAPGQAEHEGRGYVQSDDVVNAGFTQGDTSYIVVQVVYDERAVVDNFDGVDITKLTRELSPKDPFGLNLMRITVDGKPIDDPNRSSEDIQRCTDVALDQADIQFQFDNLESKRRLSVAASPSTIVLRDGGPPTVNPGIAAEVEADAGSEEQQFTDAEKLVNAALTELADEAPPVLQYAPRYVGDPVRFRMYANYGAFIDRAEVRIFTADQSLQADPLEVVAFDASGFAEWLPTSERVEAPSTDLKYVLRVYDKKGNFDETLAQPLWLVYGYAGTAESDPDKVKQRHEEELLASYGENGLSVSNIHLGSGTVKVRGSGIPDKHNVWVAGREVPVDRSGNFVAEEVLPAGLHTVEVAVLDESGSGSMYLRDLEFKRDDWFYLGLADFTASEHHVSGPAGLLQGEHLEHLVERPEAAGHADEALRLLDQHQLAGEEVLHGDELVVAGDDLVRLGLERQPDAHADRLLATGALHAGLHDPRAGPGDHHPPLVGHGGREVPRLLVQRVLRQGPGRPEDRHLRHAFVRGEREERGPHLLEGRVRDLEIEPVDVVEAEADARREDLGDLIGVRVGRDLADDLRERLVEVGTSGSGAGSGTGGVHLSSASRVPRGAALPRFGLILRPAAVTMTRIGRAVR